MAIFGLAMPRRFRVWCAARIFGLRGGYYCIDVAVECGADGGGGCVEPGQAMLRADLADLEWGLVEVAARDERDAACAPLHFAGVGEGGRKMAKLNPRRGSSFDDFLKQDGIFEAVQARALKRALAEQLDDAMQAGNLTKVSMAARMSTSRSRLDRVLDPANLPVQLDTLIKAANAVGKTVEIKLRRQSKHRAVAA